MGGTTGLFVGASLLSFVEILYYFIVRPYGTVYLARKNAENQVAPVEEETAQHI